MFVYLNKYMYLNVCLPYLAASSSTYVLVLQLTPLSVVVHLSPVGLNLSLTMVGYSVTSLMVSPQIHSPLSFLEIFCREEEEKEPLALCILLWERWCTFSFILMLYMLNTHTHTINNA